MLSTENIGLKKPGYNDEADIAVINENMDTIDAELSNRYTKTQTYSNRETDEAIANAINALPRGLIYRGAVDYYNNLPSENNELGDTYSIKYQGTSGTEPDGNEYAWGKYDGTLQWIPLGVDSYTKKEIDEQRSSIESDILSLYKNSHNRGIASAKANPNKWYKIGEYTSNVTLNTTLLITSRYLDIQGLLTLTANISATSSGVVWGSTALKANWLGLRTITDNRSKYNITDIFKFGGTLTNGILHCELWVKIPTSWDIFSTVILYPNQNSSYPWEVLSSDTAFDSYPEFEKISSPTDMLFDFETRLTALETALAQTQTE